MVVVSDYPVTITVFLFLIGTTVLTYCFAVRTIDIQSWRGLGYAHWLILLVYVDSYLFVISTSILQVGIGVNSNYASCESLLTPPSTDIRAAIFMCIFFYCSSKVIIYLFLIERVHIVRGGYRTRLQDKLYLFNMFGLLPYCVIVILAIVFRVNEIQEDEKCYIGLKRQSSFLLLVYDLVINVYLTIMFLLPILGVYAQSFTPNTRLRKVAIRTLIGTIGTLISSVANVSAVFALKGLEPAFICLACCTADVAFSAVVLHWVTAVTDDTPTYNKNTLCPFHGPSPQRKSGCCIAPGTRRGTVTHATLTSTAHSIHGVDGPNTVVTEIKCDAPEITPPERTVLQKLARLSKQAEGRLSKQGFGGGKSRGHGSKGSKGDVMELMEREQRPGSAGTAGITVSYDVWRRSEEAPPVPPKDIKVTM